MKAILSVALVLGICALTNAADGKSDPVGKWKCEYKIGDQERTATLTLKKDGDKLAGAMSWADQKEEKLKDVKATGSDVSFSVVRKLMDNEIPISYKLTFEGDKFKGKGSSEFGGQKTEWDINGTREK